MDKKVEVKPDGQRDNSGALRTLESVAANFAIIAMEEARRNGETIEIPSLGITIPPAVTEQ